MASVAVFFKIYTGSRRNWKSG